MLKKLALLLALPFALAMSTLAVAQSNPPTPPPFAALGGQTTISATNTSSRVALPVSTVPFGALTVYNTSTTVDAYVALGDVTVVAVSSAGTCAAPTFTMCLVKAGTSIVIWAGSNTYIAGITSSSTASLVIYQGSGGVQLSAIYSGTSPPSGPAGGDLSGTYPNPTVVQATGAFSTGGRITTTVATEQLRLGFDGSNYTSFTVGSTGGLTLGGAGAGTNSLTAPGGTLAGGVSVGFYNSNVVAFPSTGIAVFTSGAVNGTKDTGLTRDSVLGAGNLDLGNGTANDKTGTLNAAKVALGGCTPGTDSLCSSGTATVSSLATSSGNLQTAASFVSLSDSGQLRFGASQDARLIRIGPASLAFGLPDAAAPVAQTLGVQNVVAGTSNTIGQPWSLNGSQSTGTAAGGSVLIKTAAADQTHTVNTFTGSASPYTIGFTAGAITTYPVGTVMTVSGCTTATLNGTYTVTASSSGSVTATTSATGTGSPTTCLIVGNTSQNPATTVVTIDSFGALVLSGATTNASFSQLGGGSNVYNGSILAGGTTLSNGSVFLYRGSDNANVLTTATGGMGWSGTSSPSGNSDTSLWRQAAGVVQVSTAQTANANGSLKFASYIAGGTAPVGSGTCTRGTQNGGLTAGSIVLTCTAQTLILTFTTTAPTGWMCEAIDQTTTADTMKQTANSTTTCTLTGTTAASDVVIYQARAY